MPRSLPLFFLLFSSASAEDKSVDNLAELKRRIKEEGLEEQIEMKPHFEDRRALLDARNEWCKNKEQAEKDYGPINEWDVSRVTDFSFMFCSFPGMASRGCNPACGNFNDNINDWDVSKAMSMEKIFFGTHGFNQPLDKWDVSGVYNFDYAFWQCYDFNQPIGNWDVSKATSMQATFDTATSFNQDISAWDVSNLRKMDGFMDNIGNKLSECNRAKIHAAFSKKTEMWTCTTPYTCANKAGWGARYSLSSCPKEEV